MMKFKFRYRTLCRAIHRALSSRRLATEFQVQFQTSACGICGVHSGTETRFLPSVTDFPCERHSINDASSFNPPSATLYNLSN